jgi:hypothetical protein
MEKLTTVMDNLKYTDKFCNALILRSVWIILQSKAKLSRQNVFSKIQLFNVGKISQITLFRHVKGLHRM